MNRETGFLVAVAGMVVVVLAAPALAGTTTSADKTTFEIDRTLDIPAEPERAGVATVGDQTFDSASGALQAAEPGDTVVLEGRFEESLTIATDGVTVRASEDVALVDGGGDGRVVTVTGEDVTVDGLWIRNSGNDIGSEDGGVFVDGNGTELQNVTITDVAFGVWVNGVDNVTVADSTIQGRPEVQPRTDRGNGIQLWETAHTTVENNRITDVRDGIYYSWASDVRAANNTMWNNRYGVHYMYSNDNRLVDNVAVDNDVGYALMVSEGLELVNNHAVGNAGTSGHGILVKDVERSTIRGNTLVENGNGLYVTNAQDNDVVENLILRNKIGIHSTAGSSGQRVVANSFIENGKPAHSTVPDVVRWNGTDRGNYWSGAQTADLTNDGTSEITHRPAGLVEHVVAERPEAAVFANSPAFDTVRLAESSFPVIDSPGIVDQHPLVEPPHEDWQNYADNR